MKLNAYVITEPVETIIFATSMGMAVSLYLHDVVAEDELYDAYHDSPEFSQNGLTVIRATSTDTLVDGLLEAEYFETASEALAAIAKVENSDDATIFVLDNSVA